MACAAPKQSGGPGAAGLRGSTTPPNRRVGRPVAAHLAAPFTFFLLLTVTVTGGADAADVAFFRLLGGESGLAALEHPDEVPCRSFN